MNSDNQQATYLRGSVCLLHIALPLLGLGLLVVRPEMDLHVQHNPTHFWLVAGVALINVVIATRITAETARRADARLFLVSLAFQVSAAFIGLHALATPQVFLAAGNVGFTLASPVGLFLAAVIVAVSSLEFDQPTADWINRHQRFLRAGVLGIVVLWAFLSLNQLPPLAGGAPEELAGTWLVWLALVTVLIYLWSAYRYYLLHRRRPSAVTLALITAFLLLAEAMVAVIFSTTWRLSWWEWHFLALAAFGYVGYAAYLQYRKEGRPAGLFDSVVLEETVARVRDEYRQGLERLVLSNTATDAAGRREAADQLGDQLGLSGMQVDFLVQAAEAVSAERRHGEMLAALAEVGGRTRVAGEDETLVQGVVETTARASGYDVRVSLLEHGEWRPLSWQPADSSWASPGVEEVPGLIRSPIEIQGNLAGVLEARSDTEIPSGDRALFRSMAGQLSIALENQRLYRELRGLFGRYTSPEVASALLSGGTQLELGGSVTEVTVLFADLKGFTSFSERVAHPKAVVDLLNRYLSAAVPVVRGHGGTVDKFVGDALMALFNTPVLQADHALRAARAALEMQAAVASLGEEDLSFRIGINTGPALVGNIGSEDLRNFTAIGDAVNVAARLEALAEPGEIVIGPATATLIRHVAELRPLGEIEVKGRAEPVHAFGLVALNETYQ